MSILKQWSLVLGCSIVAAAAPRVAGAVQPEQAWSTYLGGTKNDQINAVALDAAGNIYVTGQTLSPTNFAAGGVFDSTHNGGYDAFLVKYNAAGVRQWGFYLPGAGDDKALVMVIRGERVVIGGTSSFSGLGTPGTFQPEPLSNQEGFIVEFNLAGEFVWGTYVGSPNGGNAVNSLAFGDAGELYACGVITAGGGVALGAKHQPNHGGAQDGFLMRLDTAGKRVWGTYYGGSGQGGYEECGSVGYRSGGGVFIAGMTPSGNNISTMGGPASIRDAFVARFYDTGIRDWGRYFGGDNYDLNTKMVVHPDGGLVLYLQTNSLNMATDGTNYSGGGQNQLVIARLADTGETIWATYFGGPGENFRGGFALGPDGSIFISGSTFSFSGIASPDAFQTENLFGYEGFLAKLSPAGVHEWGTYVAGPGGNEGLNATVVRDDGSVIVGGITASADGMATAGGQQTVFGGVNDGYLARFNPLKVGPPKDPLGAACGVADDCASGFCADGVCCDAACGDSDADDCQACSVADGAPVDGTCQPRVIGTQCRPASDECDDAEACDGVAVACPLDQPAPDGSPCPDGLCSSGLCLPDEQSTSSGDMSSTGDASSSGGASSGDGGSSGSSEDSGSSGDETGAAGSSTTGPMDTTTSDGIADTDAPPVGSMGSTDTTGDTESTGDAPEPGGNGGCTIGSSPGLFGVLLALGLRRRRARRASAPR